LIFCKVSPALSYPEQMAKLFENDEYSASQIEKDYHDSLRDKGNAPTTMVFSSTRGPVHPTSPRKMNKPRPLQCLFPSKLYKMLEEVDSMGLSAAVSWQSHGHAFAIKNKDLFLNEAVPRFFKATKIRSFERQCLLWGFKRIPSGRDIGAWWHESFVRGQPKDLKNIARTQLKGTTTHVAHVPDFYFDEKIKGNSCSKALPCMEISVINREHSLGADNMPTVSSCNIDKGLENINDELEALFRKISPTQISSDSPYILRKNDYLSDDVPELNLSSTKSNQSLRVGNSSCILTSSSNMAQKASLKIPFSHFRSSFAHTSQYNIIENSYTRDPVHVGHFREGTYAYDDVDTDEFSKFIDETIQLT